MTDISLVTNGITDAVFGFDYKNPESYNKLYEGLKTIGISYAYLYYFKRTIRHKSKIKWIESEKLDLSAYADGEKVFVPPSDERNMTYDKVLNHKFLPEERFTMVFEPLFSERKLYGLFLCQVKREFYDTITPMCLQISLAIKSMKLLEKQKTIRDNLETDLLMAQKNYEELNVISNVDSLTKVFNRRGYRAGVKKLTQNPLNDGRIALIMSGDMDNLKYINDTYGHDEGDFALCEVAKVLVEAYRSSDVIARFGGDEFAAFALVDKKGCIPVFKERIRKIIDDHNKIIDKPYMIDISTGFCEVVCEADLDSEKCYDEADKLMYQEKRKKKEEKNGGKLGDNRGKQEFFFS
jgi:diguanylate cyclase (GGDEF)-like protein